MTHPDPSSPERDAALTREAVRLTRRYIDEIVLTYGLCPWARGSLETQRVEIVPVLGSFSRPDGPARAAARALEILNAQAPSTELLLLPFPEVVMSRPEFDQIARHLRALDREKRFALAVFHPDPVANVQDAARAAMFLRRTPDPLIQVVRSEVLAEIAPEAGAGTTFIGPEALVALLAPAEPRSLRDRVLSHNFATLNKVGPAELERALQAIQLDRVESYARLSRAEEGETP